MNFGFLTWKPRSAIKFCALPSKTAKGTDELLKEAYKDSAIKFTTVRKRHKHFTEGHEQTCGEAGMGWSGDAKQSRTLRK